MEPGARRARWAGRALVAVIAAVLVIDGVDVVRRWDQIRPVRAGQSAPTFSLPRISLDGQVGAEMLSLESLRGRVVVLDFWETWCRPCHQAMPVLERLAATHTAADLVIVSVCSDGTREPERARALVDQLAPSALLVADDGVVADLYGVATIPHMVVLDRQGNVAEVHRRFEGVEPLERDLRAVLDELLGREPSRR